MAALPTGRRAGLFQRPLNTGNQAAGTRVGITSAPGRRAMAPASTMASLAAPAMGGRDRPGTVSGARPVVVLYAVFAAPAIPVSAVLS